MNLTVQKAAGEPVSVPLAPEENLARIHSSNFEKITGEFASENTLKPWKGRVVRLTSKGGSVYRILRSHGKRSITGDTIWLGPKTSTQLGLDVGETVKVSRVWQPLGRFLYYQNHLDDTVRFAFRIGFWGLIFAVFSLILSIVPLLSRH